MVVAVPAMKSIPGVSFVTRAGLGLLSFRSNTAMPPAPPPVHKSLGGYCLRATCSVTDVQGCEIARVKGYDKNMAVARNTEIACRQHVRALKGQGRLKCSEAEVVMLASSPLECSGQVFFVMDGATKQLV